MSRFELVCWGAEQAASAATPTRHAIRRIWETPVRDIQEAEIVIRVRAPSWIDRVQTINTAAQRTRLMRSISNQR